MQLGDSDASVLGALARRHFGEAARVLESAACPSVRLWRGDACPSAYLGSRFGGSALRPAEHIWPVTRGGKPLAFLAQVSTADIQVPAGIPGLPADTLLAFFYEAEEQDGWGFIQVTGSSGKSSRSLQRARRRLTRRKGPGVSLHTGCCPDGHDDPGFWRAVPGRHRSGL